MAIISESKADTWWDSLEGGGLDPGEDLMAASEWAVDSTGLTMGTWDDIFIPIAGLENGLRDSYEMDLRPIDISEDDFIDIFREVESPKENPMEEFEF